MRRTHTCGALRQTDCGRDVVLAGWIHSRRDHGGLVFLDLRDQEGMTQVVVNPAVSPAAYRTVEDVEKVRSESVLEVRGRVVRRPGGTENPALPTGEVEVVAHEVVVHNRAKVLPFQLFETAVASEALRLTYRYLDLRQPFLQQNLFLRHRVMMEIRRFLDSRKFVEIETPHLARSTPEGARDFLVPSRLNPGSFYALTQSPQLFKQLLMVAGFDRYFQIARCFRDEDLRADRQPEFTQLDLEMAFVERDDVIGVTEELFVALWKDVKGIDLRTPFARLTHAEALARYGTDTPDLRTGMEQADLTRIAADAGFEVFRDAIGKGQVVYGMVGRGLSRLSRKELDGLVSEAKKRGAKGLVWIKWLPDGSYNSPVVRHFPEPVLQDFGRVLRAERGDLFLLVADRPQTVTEALTHLREVITLRWAPTDEAFHFVWVTDFPLLTFDEQTRRYVAVHHPFTSPMEEDLALLETDPLKVRARAYDLVLNGQEIGGGSIRNHRRGDQERLFELLGFTREEMNAQFGFLLDALEYGAPPHGGIALGLDRVVAVLCGTTTIRDVIAFPKTQRAFDLLTNAPAPVSPGQLKELHMRLEGP